MKNKQSQRRYKALSDLAELAMKCPYCAGPVKLTQGTEIYPHREDLAKLPFYLCKPCKAYVGCHPGTTKPLGRLANATLRWAKSSAHAAFDPLWQSGHMSRPVAYSWLSQQLGIPTEDCHIGMFDAATCHKVVAICRDSPFDYEDSDLI